MISNYPNPFNSRTVISYNLLESSSVNLKLYDILGREIQTLISGYHEAGEYKFIWQAENVATGVYFYRLTLDDTISRTGMMTLLK